MSKEWDKENMKVLAVNMKKEEAEMFKKLAEEEGSTVGSMLRGYVHSQIRTPGANVRGVEHIVNYKNTDRLKHEVAFHNPNHLNPDQMLNYILDKYFSFLDEARK